MATPQAQSKVPAIPEPGRGIDPQTRKAIIALKEALEIRLGRSRTPLDAAVTFRDLKEGGVEITLGGQQAGGTIDGGTIPPFINQLPRPDYTPPPAPTGVATSGGFDYVFITWDRPAITGDYYTEVYRYTADDLDAAQTAGVIGFTQGPGIQFSDPLDNPATYYYWVRFVKVVYGTLVPGPFHDTAGIQGAITQDPNHIVNIISGYIEESDLAAALATKVSRIDIGTTISAHVANELLNVSQRLDNVNNDARTIEQFYTAFETLEQAITDPQTGVDLTAVVTRVDSLESQVFNVNDAGGGSELTLQQFYTSYDALETSANSPGGEIRLKLLDGEAAKNRIDTLDDGAGGSTTIESVVTDFRTIESEVSDPSTGLSTRAAQSDYVTLQSQVDAIDGAADASLLVQRVDALETSIDDPSTGLDTKASQSTVTTIQSDLSTLSGEVSSYSGSITQLTASVGDIQTALEITGSVSTRMDDVETVLDASYTVRIDLDGYVIGYGIAGGSGQPSEFIVRADSVFFLDPSQSGTFVAGQNYPTVDDLPNEFIMGYAQIDGETKFAFNAPVYIPEGSISTLHVREMDFSKITGFDINTEILNVNQTGWITNAMIGNVIQSTWPNTSNPSWKLEKNGIATFRGINIYNQNTGELILSSGSGITWETLNGQLPSNKLDINGNNIDEYFAPKSIDGVTYIKDASVDTLQIRGQAVTFPIFMQIPGANVSTSTWTTVGSVSWAGSGVNTAIFVSLAYTKSIRYSIGSGWLVFPTPNYGAFAYRLKHNGVVVNFSVASDLLGDSILIPDLSGSSAAGAERSGIAQVNSVSGTNTITLEAYSPLATTKPSNTVWTGETVPGRIAARIFAIELKK